jgi:hypothetical protein
MMDCICCGDPALWRFWFLSSSGKMLVLRAFVGRSSDHPFLEDKRRESFRSCDVHGWVDIVVTWLWRLEVA